MAISADDYQGFTETTEVYTQAARNFIKHTDPITMELWLKVAYCTGKLNGESGEIAELVFKALRDGSGLGMAGYIDPERKAKIKKELGDAQWYIARLADIFGWKLSEIMEDNMIKLQSRKDRGVLSGSGDDR